MLGGAHFVSNHREKLPVFEVGGSACEVFSLLGRREE
jgi:hypothetical protein